LESGGRSGSHSVPESNATSIAEPHAISVADSFTVTWSLAFATIAAEIAKSDAASAALGVRVTQVLLF
jgi:hypothetical protein